LREKLRSLSKQEGVLVFQVGNAKPREQFLLSWPSLSIAVKADFVVNNINIIFLFF
jgi:hypothetical protein